MWDPMYIPPCLKEALTELSPPAVLPQVEELFMLAQRKRKCSLIIPLDEQMLSSPTIRKKMKSLFGYPLQESTNSVLPLPPATPPSSNASSMPPSIESGLLPVRPQMVCSLKKTLQMSKKSCPSHLSLGTQTVDLRLQTLKHLVSWNDFIAYGAVIPNESSFAARCSRSRAKAPPIQPTPFPSQPYPYLKTLWTHPLLDQFPWHPNQMLPSDEVPVVDVDTDDQQEVWGCLYIKFRALFRSQLSWCLATRHDLLTHRLRSGSTAIEDPTTSLA